MDSVKAEKLQAMEKHRRSQFPQILFQFALRVVLLGLFMSSPNWIPSICSFVKFFFVVCLPRMGAMLTGPKFIFIVSNMIIVFLAGESRLSKFTAQPDVYDEYAAMKEQTQSLQSVSTVAVKEEEEKEAIFAEPLLEETKGKEEKPEKKDEEEEVAINGEGEEEEEEEEETEQSQEAEEEEEEGLPAEELNMRAEAFIAKINMQRKLEAKMLVCYE